MSVAIIIFLIKVHDRMIALEKVLIKIDYYLSYTEYTLICINQLEFEQSFLKRKFFKVSN